jgi:hypothetical protein
MWIPQNFLLVLPFRPPNIHTDFLKPYLPCAKQVRLIFRDVVVKYNHAAT